MQIVTVVGARPQFVKAAAMAAGLRTHPLSEQLTHHVVHTGQHYDDDMSGVFFRELRLDPPQCNLEVGSGGHGAQTGEMMRRLEPVLIDLDPDVVLVYGDTNSTLAAAVVAAKLDMPIAHVEAGLRSHRQSMPEEVNRVLTDHVSTWLFCPSDDAAGNCRREGITAGVEVVGDIMRDAFDIGCNERSPVLELHDLAPGKFALATIHRAENTDDPDRLNAITDGLLAIVAAGVPVVLPLHPRTREHVDVDRLRRQGLSIIEPQSFMSMVALEAAAQVILTDSGGVQKEAIWAGVPCVTLRDETEWVETVESGWNRLVPPDPIAIRDAALQPPPAGQPPSLYGDGCTAHRILDVLTAG